MDEEHISYWLKSAEHDFETAQSLYEVAWYDWCLFVGHLVLEKVLKAIFVKRNDNQIPPKTHSLVRLAELCNINLDLELKITLDRINDFNLETRYPNYKLDFYKIKEILTTGVRLV